jgi:hypothetical protein
MIRKILSTLLSQYDRSPRSPKPKNNPDPIIIRKRKAAVVVYR